MPQRWMKTLLAMASAAVLFTSCKGTFSNDEPLPEEFTPSLFISSQNEFLYALDPNTGAKKWEYYIGANVQATPVVLGEFLFLPTDDSLVKMDAKRGTVIKKYYFQDAVFRSFVSSPTGQGVMLYIGSTNDTMYALDANEDKIKWKFNAGAPILSSPIINNGQLIFANASGKVYALEISNGSQNWVYTLGGKTSSWPAVAAPYVFIGCEDGKMYCLNLTDGTQRWAYQTGGIILSSPIAYGGNVLFGSNDHFVYCIDTVAAVERWKYETADRVISSPVAARQTVYIAGLDYNMYAINIIDGTEKWRFKTNALIRSTPLLHDKTLYFGSFDKNMYAVDTNGYLRWSKSIDGIVESSPVLWDLNKAYYPAVSGLSQY